MSSGSFIKLKMCSSRSVFVIGHRVAPALMIKPSGALCSRPCSDINQRVCYQSDKDDVIGMWPQNPGQWLLLLVFWSGSKPFIPLSHGVNLIFWTNERWMSNSSRVHVNKVVRNDKVVIMDARMLCNVIFEATGSRLLLQMDRIIRRILQHPENDNNNLYYVNVTLQSFQLTLN